MSKSKLSDLRKVDLSKPSPSPKEAAYEKAAAKHKPKKDSVAFTLKDHRKIRGIR